MSSSSTTYAGRYWTTPRAAQPASFARALARLIRAVATEWRIRRDLRELMALNDHMLKDIGVSRAQVAHAARFGRFE
jgi:uncharacterized protein YjiS (DUF1127 family)